MDNALVFTGLLVLAALAGGFFGAACARGKWDATVEARLAEHRKSLELALKGIVQLKDRMGSEEDKMQGIWSWAGDLYSHIDRIDARLADCQQHHCSWQKKEGQDG